MLLMSILFKLINPFMAVKHAHTFSSDTPPHFKGPRKEVSLTPPNLVS